MQKLTTNTISKYIENPLQQISLYMKHQITQLQHKHAAFKCMLHRLIIIPMKQEDYAAELNTIEYIVQRNDYKDTLHVTYWRQPNIQKPKTWHKL